MAMFAAGPSERINFVLDRALLGASIGDVLLVRRVIHALYEQRRKSIVRSPERPELQLSQEEAAGYLLAALSGVELLSSSVLNLPVSYRYLGFF